VVIATLMALKTGGDNMLMNVTPNLIASGIIFLAETFYSWFRCNVGGSGSSPDGLAEKSVKQPGTPSIRL